MVVVTMSLLVLMETCGAAELVKLSMVKSTVSAPSMSASSKVCVAITRSSTGPEAVAVYTIVASPTVVKLGVIVNVPLAVVTVMGAGAVKSRGVPLNVMPLMSAGPAEVVDAVRSKVIVSLIWISPLILIVWVAEFPSSTLVSPASDTSDSSSSLIVVVTVMSSTIVPVPSSPSRRMSAPDVLDGLSRIIS